MPLIERDDPIWAYVLEQRLMPYIESVREWWSLAHTLVIKETGVRELSGPPGLAMRFTRTSAKSSIRGIQAFPFVPTAYLQINGVAGGAVRMIAHVCANDTFTIDEFTIVCKSNVPTIANKGQFIAFIPTNIYQGTTLGAWMYITYEEALQLSKGNILPSVDGKAIKVLSAHEQP